MFRIDNALNRDELKDLKNKLEKVIEGIELIESGHSIIQEHFFDGIAYISPRLNKEKMSRKRGRPPKSSNVHNSHLNTDYLKNSHSCSAISNNNPAKSQEKLKIDSTSLILEVLGTKGPLTEGQIVSIITQNAIPDNLPQTEINRLQQNIKAAKKRLNEKGMIFQPSGKRGSPWYVAKISSE